MVNKSVCELVIELPVQIDIFKMSRQSRKGKEIFEIVASAVTECSHTYRHWNELIDRLTD